MIRRVSILGPGLLGGSIALAVDQQLPDVEVSLWGRREEPITLAKSLGLEKATTDLGEAIAGVDLIILATPVGVMASMVQRVLELRPEGGFLITDVGSVKRLPHQEITPLLDGRNVSFIGSHPMAGSEQAGMEAARANLIRGAACLVTNEGGASDDALNSLKNFWLALGCRVREMTAEDHDYAVARVSHFPHLFASICATVGLEFEDIGDLCGGGMRDTSRVASGDADLWTEILMENRDALQRSMGESQQMIDSLMTILRDGDREAMHAFLLEAKRRRDMI